MSEESWITPERYTVHFNSDSFEIYKIKSKSQQSNEEAIDFFQFKIIILVHH